MAPDTDTIERLRESYAACFGCGLENTHGLKLDGFEVDEDTVTAAFVPQERFQGFEGVLHGGIVATALDEISAWSAMLTQGVFVFTAKLEIAYRGKSPVGSSLQLSGRVEERRGRRLTIAGSMTHDGKTVAESNGLFVAAQSVEPT